MKISRFLVLFGIPHGNCQPILHNRSISAVSRRDTFYGHNDNSPELGCCFPIFKDRTVLQALFKDFFARPDKKSRISKSCPFVKFPIRPSKSHDSLLSPSCGTAHLILFQNLVKRKFSKLFYFDFSKYFNMLSRSSKINFSGTTFFFSPKRTFCTSSMAFSNSSFTTKYS